MPMARISLLKGNPPAYLEALSDGVHRALVCITAGRPRSAATKAAFYRRMTGLLAASPGIAHADVIIIVTTTSPEDREFSGGLPWVPARQESAP